MCCTSSSFLINHDIIVVIVAQKRKGISITQSAMNEEKSQLEVSYTAVAFQYQTTYSHCPTMPQSNTYKLYSNNQCHKK